MFVKLKSFICYFYYWLIFPLIPLGLSKEARCREGAGKKNLVYIDMTTSQNCCRFVSCKSPVPPNPKGAQ